MAAQLQVLGSFAESSSRANAARRSELRVLLILREGSTLVPICADILSAGYTLCQVCSWIEVLRNFPFSRPDLIVLNVGVPDTDGKQILRQLRDWTSAPIIVISSQSGDLQRIEFLDIGADDYLTEPLDKGEFLARLRAASRRAFGVPRSEIFRSGSLEVDFSRREVRVQHRQVKLTATEYDLLKVLAGHAGQVQTHYQLIHEVWGGTQYHDALHLLRVTVYNLRRKLVAGSSLAGHVVTEPGIGYKLRCERGQALPDEVFRHLAASFDRLFQHFPDAMILLNAEGRCLSANHACQSLFLWQEDRFKSLDVDMFHGNLRELHRFRTTLDGKDSIKDFRISICQREDTRINCSLTAMAWRDKDARLTGYTVRIQPQ